MQMWGAVTAAKNPQLGQNTKSCKKNEALELWFPGWYKRIKKHLCVDVKSMYRFLDSMTYIQYNDFRIHWV